MAVEVVAKMAVSVTEMARMLGLSRARFYQLVRSGTFPAADHDPLRPAIEMLPERCRKLI